MMKKGIRIFIYAFIAFLAMSCLHEEIVKDALKDDEIAPVNDKKFAESEEPVNMSGEDARSSARTSFKTLASNMDRLGDEFARMNPFFSGEASSSEKILQEMLSGQNADLVEQLNVLAKSKFFADFSTRLNKTGSLSAREGQGSLSDEVDEFFAKYMIVEDKTGNTVSYKFDPAICDDSGNVDEVQTCKDIIENITIVQTLASDSAGTIVLKYGDFTPLILGYSPDEWYLETNLADLKFAILKLQVDIDVPANEKVEFPEVFEGVVRASISLPAEDQLSLSYGVLTDVTINGLMDERTLDIYVARSRIIVITADFATENLTVETGLAEFRFIADNQNDAYYKNYFEIRLAGFDSKLVFVEGKLDMDFDIGVFSFIFDEEDVAEEQKTKTEISMDGFTADISITEEQLVAKNFGIKNDDFSILLDDKKLFSLDFPKVDFTVDLTNDNFSSQSDVDISVDVVNVNGEFAKDIFKDEADPTDETLAANVSVSLPSGSLISIIKNGDILKVVEGGPFLIQGSGGNLEGGLTVEVGECFTSPEDNFPQLVDCPAN